MIFYWVGGVRLWRSREWEVEEGWWQQHLFSSRSKCPQCPMCPVSRAVTWLYGVARAGRGAVWWCHLRGCMQGPLSLTTLGLYCKTLSTSPPHPTLYWELRGGDCRERGAPKRGHLATQVVSTGASVDEAMISLILSRLYISDDLGNFSRRECGSRWRGEGEGGEGGDLTLRGQRTQNKDGRSRQAKVFFHLYILPRAIQVHQCKPQLPWDLLERNFYRQKI